MATAARLRRIRASVDALLASPMTVAAYALWEAADAAGAAVQRAPGDAAAVHRLRTLVEAAALVAAHQADRNPALRQLGQRLAVAAIDAAEMEAEAAAPRARRMAVCS